MHYSPFWEAFPSGRWRRVGCTALSAATVFQLAQCHALCRMESFTQIYTCLASKHRRHSGKFSCKRVSRQRLVDDAANFTQRKNCNTGELALSGGQTVSRESKLE